MHLKEKFSIVNNDKPLLRRYSIPSKPLLSIHKTLLRPHLDYCDANYDKPPLKGSETPQNQFKYLSGAIKGTFKEKLYNELGQEYPRDREWM